ncbi:MAG: metallophosphoesterase [Idiomarina sp.]|nr:metallophosphoesterase [Idiomarina sp.]
MSGWQLACPVRRLTINQQGRDFVVGDLHGSLSQLRIALKSLNFNAKCDRVLSVGDLVDRGPGSRALIDWLDFPWFYACIGNHEAVLLDYMSTQDAELARTWCRFGGGWFFTLPDDEQAAVAAKIQQHCSYAIEIADEHHVAFGIVHADVPGQLSWQTFCEQVVQQPEVKYDALWSRSRGRGESTHVVEGVNQVICGHEIVAQVHQQGNVWLLDTGAYKGKQGGGKLSILELPDRLHTFTDQ